ncbi:glycoside hydrolase family 18 protein [Annulohypoxylon maeteangense]|uniref:glycoside hydrolase family 18 protein n=1 Tax=Annulohypoxylon maeteangense TaxID=1927788 RepID=UPI0020075D1C|nr:glycoside hydrolase family 18 protein [Annulohypoxylon maeteangense]KAI0887550.1 glycoside hydrolase family 18 protein [Annulohypoxylon maeteangense]
MRAVNTLASLAMAGLAAAEIRNLVYFDQYHTSILPGKNITAGITHVAMAFANSSLFAAETAGTFKPWMPIDSVRAMFDNGTKLGIAIGGWGDTAGFSAGAKTEASRATYAKNVAAMVEELGFDFVDVDWEYPGGNGQDYKQIPNANKTSEIISYPQLLHAIKAAIEPKPLSIAVPAKQGDLIAYTAARAPAIFSAVDMVNVMSYDIMNRRDTTTTHHSSVAGSLEAVHRYLELGCPPSKINLGLAYYAKFFETAPNATCTHPIGCPIVKAENDDGSDAGTSGAVTFEKANVFPAPPPTNLTTSSDGTCGATKGLTCTGFGEGTCCSQYGNCGSSAAHCGLGCQSGFGTCTGPDISAAFPKALANGVLDAQQGGMWYWDAENRLFWTWDTTELMKRKFKEIIEPMGLGGVMAWSLGEDSADWSHITTVAKLAKGTKAPLDEAEGEGGVKRAVRKLRGRIARPHGRQWAH